MRYFPSLQRVFGILLFSLCMILLLSPEPALSIPTVGGPFPKIVLPTPDKAAEREYLGLPERETFGIGDVSASVVVIEFFSMYCPHCQAEAPRTVEIFERIKRDPNLSKRAKMIGIGVGNSDYEVNIFKKKYRIPFPLFPDGDYKIFDLVDVRFTPTYIVARVQKGKATVVYTQVGRVDDLEAFFSMLSSIK